MQHINVPILEKIARIEKLDSRASAKADLLKGYLHFVYLWFNLTDDLFLADNTINKDDCFETFFIIMNYP